MPEGFFLGRYLTIIFSCSSLKSCSLFLRSSEPFLPPMLGSSDDPTFSLEYTTRGLLRLGPPLAECLCSTLASSKDSVALVSSGMDSSAPLIDLQLGLRLSLERETSMEW